jgi:hypothetical protein
MFIIFSAIGVLWTTMVVKGGPDSHKIHYLMIVLVAFKALTLLSQVCGGLSAGWAGCGCMGCMG